MFKVKHKITGEIHQILDVYTDEVTDVTFFFLWDNDGWRWRPANNFVPPNYNLDNK